MVLEHEHDLLMMESGGEGPLAVVVPPPGDFHPRDNDLYDHYDYYDYYDHYDYYDDDHHEDAGLRVEGREAAPTPWPWRWPPRSGPRWTRSSSW